jgi:hypothetical protein
VFLFYEFLVLVKTLNLKWRWDVVIANLKVSPTVRNHILLFCIIWVEIKDIFERTSYMSWDILLFLQSIDSLHWIYEKSTLNLYINIRNCVNNKDSEERKLEMTRILLLRNDKIYKFLRLKSNCQKMENNKKRCYN